MFLGINGSTIESCALPEFLEISARVGFPSVELRMPRIDEYLEHQTLDDLRALLDKHGLRVVSINSIENSTLQDAEGEKRILAEVEKFARCAAEVSCPWLVICPGNRPEGMSWDDVLTTSGAQLARIADVAQHFRVGVSFEFIGNPACSVRTPSGAWAVVREANRGNLGITVDVANFHTGGGLLAEISALPPGAVAICHVNDLRSMNDPVKAGTYDRVMPGDGMSPVAAIIRELQRIGYAGVAAVETFNHDYNKRDAFEVAKEAFDKTRALVAREQQRTLNHRRLFSPPSPSAPPSGGGARGTTGSTGF